MIDFIFGVLLDNICRGMFRMVALDTMSIAARERLSPVVAVHGRVIIDTGFRTESENWQ